MSNPWFRMYSEFSYDPKVQMLSEAMQRRYIMVMCLRCSNTLVTLQETEIAFHLRISNEEMAETKALFVAKGFIDCDWNLLNWEKRQFASDTSNARVAKHRALQKENQSTPGNGDVTLQKRNDNALDTDTDTDTDVGKKKKPRKARATSLPENFEPSERVKAWATEKGFSNIEPHFDAFVSYVKRKGATYVDWDEALMTAVRNDWGKTGGKAATNDPYGLRTAL